MPLPFRNQWRAVPKANYRKPPRAKDDHKKVNQQEMRILEKDSVKIKAQVDDLVKKMDETRGRIDTTIAIFGVFIVYLIARQ